MDTYIHKHTYSHLPFLNKTKNDTPELLSSLKIHCFPPIVFILTVFALPPQFIHKNFRTFVIFPGVSQYCWTCDFLPQVQTTKVY